MSRCTCWARPTTRPDTTRPDAAWGSERPFQVVHHRLTSPRPQVDVSILEPPATAAPNAKPLRTTSPPAPESRRRQGGRRAAGRACEVGDEPDLGVQASQQGCDKALCWRHGLLDAASPGSLTRTGRPPAYCSAASALFSTVSRQRRGRRSPMQLRVWNRLEDRLSGRLTGLGSMSIRTTPVPGSRYWKTSPASTDGPGSYNLLYSPQDRPYGWPLQAAARRASGDMPGTGDRSDPAGPVISSSRGRAR